MLSKYASNAYKKSVSFQGRAYFNVDSLTLSRQDDNELLLDEINPDELTGAPILLSHIGKNSSGEVLEGASIGTVQSAYIDKPHNSLLISGTVNAPFAHLIHDKDYKSLSIGYHYPPRSNRTDTYGKQIRSKKTLNEISLCNRPVVPGCSLFGITVNNSQDNSHQISVQFAIEEMDSTTPPSFSITQFTPQSTTTAPVVAPVVTSITTNPPITTTTPVVAQVSQTVTPQSTNQGSSTGGFQMPDNEEGVIQILSKLDPVEKDKMLAKSLIDRTKSQQLASQKIQSEKEMRFQETETVLKKSLASVGLQMDDKSTKALSQHDATPVILKSFNDYQSKIVSAYETGVNSVKMELETVKKTSEELRASNEDLKRKNENLTKECDFHKRKKVDTSVAVAMEPVNISLDHFKSIIDGTTSQKQGISNAPTGGYYSKEFVVDGQGNMNPVVVNNSVDKMELVGNDEVKVVNPQNTNEIVKLYNGFTTMSDLSGGINKIQEMLAGKLGRN